jgi:S-adenosylmethionine uptake transporter
MTDAPSASARKPRFSPVALALIAIFLGCCLDAIIKHLGASYTAILVACGRYCFGAVFTGALVLALRRARPSARMLRAHAIRAIASTISAVLLFHAFALLQLAEATVLLFCAPLMIAPLARWLLKEKLKPIAMLALVIGFAGVLVTVQGAPPEAASGRHLEGVLSAVGAAALYALSLVLLRQLAQRDDAYTTAFLGNAFPALFLIGPAILLGDFPATTDLPAFAATGFFGSALWLLLTQAYARAPAQNLAPTEYSALIWSALLGYIFFSEIPRLPVWIGAVVICAAVALAAWNEHRTRPVPPAPSDALNPDASTS